MNKIKLFEGFSGYGSQKLAFERLGIEVESVGISEIDPDAIIAYAALHCDDSKYIDEELNIETKRQILIDCNVGYDFQKNKSSIPRLKKDKLEKLYKAHILSKNQGDISLIKGENLPDMDFFTYSFPCQDVSVAGKQAGLSEGSETKSSLLWQCKKVIDIKRPKYLMMENVKNLVGKNHKENFEKWLGILESFGYNNYYKVINAKDCGIPQNRERVFCVSIRKDVDNGKFVFNEPFDNGLRLRDVLEKEVDEKFYISEEITKRFIESLRDKETVLLDMCQAKREGRPREYKDIYPTLSARDYKEPRLIIEEPKNECKQIGSLDRKGYHEFSNRVYDCNSVARTIMGSGGNLNDKAGQYLMNDLKIRRLTSIECFRLMGLKDSEIDKIQISDISNSQQYKLAGNSIVVDCMFFLKNLFL